MPGQIYLTVTRDSKELAIPGTRNHFRCYVGNIYEVVGQGLRDWGVVGQGRVALKGAGLDGDACGLEKDGCKIWAGNAAAGRGTESPDVSASLAS
jgi:hypothetical protein